MTKPDKTILFLLPAAFVQNSAEPGFQVHTRNFRTVFGFLLPELRQRRMEVVLVSLNNTTRQMESGRAYLRETGFDKAVRAFFFRRQMKRGQWLHQSIQFFLNMGLLVRVLLKTRPVVVYGYNDVGTFYGAFLKAFFRYRLVYDMRGDRVNEITVQGAPAWRVWLYRLIRNFCVRSCDLVFTVSRTFEEIPLNKRHLPKFNFIDGRRFFYDAGAAENMRKQLGLEGRFVFVYSGTDKYYQMVPAMVAFFSRFLEICPDAFFMINTPVRSEVFETELKRHHIPASAYRMFSPDQENLNHYQMVADMAFLLREDLPLNHRAFPTKFSEYMGSGLPVLTTPHVHTVAEMVRDHSLGEIWDLQVPVEEIQDRILSYRNNRAAREKCAAFAAEHLLWQTKTPWLAGVLQSMHP
ncbi:MAG: glycosyl transferase [Marinilabilia sp.]